MQKYIAECSGFPVPYKVLHHIVRHCIWPAPTLAQCVTAQFTLILLCFCGIFSAVIKSLPTLLKLWSKQLLSSFCYSLCFYFVHPLIPEPCKALFHIRHCIWSTATLAQCVAAQFVSILLCFSGIFSVVMKDLPIQPKLWNNHKYFPHSTIRCASNSLRSYLELKPQAVLAIFGEKPRNVWHLLLHMFLLEDFLACTF